MAPAVQIRCGMNPRTLCGCAALLAATSLGCATTQVARDLTRGATSSAINTGLRTLDTAENQRLIARLMQSPEVHNAARALAADMVDSSLDLLSAPERQARIEEISARYVSTLTRAAVQGMAEGVRRDFAPVMAHAMKQAVAASMHEMMNEGYQRDLERVASGVTRATVEAATRSMAEGMARDMGPALRAALEDEQTRRALGSASRTLAREVVFGSNEALAEIQRQQERSGRPSLLSGLATFTERGMRVAQWGAVALVVGGILLALWIARLISRSRRAQADSERNAAAAVLLAEAIRASEGKPWGNELAEILGSRLQRESATNLLDEILTKRAKNAPPAPESAVAPPGQRLSHA